MKPRLKNTAIFFTGIGFLLTGISLLTFGTVAHAIPRQQREPFDDTACLNCHTDQQRLMELAQSIEEEETESLSSGPG